MARPLTKRPAGGWLVTYADLMTILVCFFVLIVSFSIQDKVKLEVIAGSMRDAFGVAEQRRFAGDIKIDGVPEERQPGNVIETSSPSAAGLTQTLSAPPTIGSDGYNGGYEFANADSNRRLADAKEALEAAILTHPLLRDKSESLRVNFVDDSLQVLLVDRGVAPMFSIGSEELTADAQSLLREVAAIIAPLPNRIEIVGHADATGGASYSPFALTAGRANAAREILEASGVPTTRISGVTGRGASDSLLPEDPFAPGNRRIEILLEPAAPLLPADRAL